jgi:hypothetical protein
MLPRLAIGLVLVTALASPSPSLAQGGQPLAALLPNLLLNGIVVDAAPVASGAGNPHTAHFTPANELYLGTELPDEVEEFRTILQFSRQMASQFSTAPLGSSAASFTFDTSTPGVVVQRSQSFGPYLMERAVTIGEGKWNVGVTYQHISFNTFEGSDLDDGSIKFYLEHNDCCPGQQSATGQAVGNGTLLSPAFESDIVEAALTLQVSTDTMAFYANYGVTDRLDVGVAVPIVRADIDARIRATILRLATEQNVPALHSFDGSGSLVREFRQAGSATGIGDVVIRGKYNFASFQAAGLAAAADLKVPTGDEAELLGAGAWQLKLFFIASGSGKVSPHLNVGYTFTAQNDTLKDVLGLGSPPIRDALEPFDLLSDEASYALGVDIAAHPRLTIAAGLAGRLLRGAGRLAMGDRTFVFRIEPAPGQAPDPKDYVRTFEEFQPSAENLLLLTGSVGMKYNFAANWLASAQLLLRTNDSGFHEQPSLLFGVERAF